MDEGGNKMNVKRIRKLVELAEAVDGVLELQYRGPVFVRIDEPDGSPSGLGLVELEYGLDFVGPAHPDGEGWEHFSEVAGNGLRGPRIIVDGERLTIKRARQEADVLEEATASAVPPPANDDVEMWAKG
jgi:hypothetical protein